MRYTGWVSTFWEQGMEEPAWLIFQDERYTQGDQWLREGMYELSPGDELTIYAPDGDLLWQGSLVLRRQGWFARPTLVPAEIGQSQWQQWFEMHPPLRATLVRSE